MALIRLCPLPLLAAICLAACGSASGPPPVSGQAVFARHCSTCHSLSEPATARQQGGSLQGYRLSRAELTQYAAEMPAIHGRMNARELHAVVSYVLSVQRR